MIKLLTGRPGCGKSYRAVHDYMIEKDKYYLFHNIDELKSDQIDEGKYIRDFEHLEGILLEKNRKNYQQKLQKNIIGICSSLLMKLKTILIDSILRSEHGWPIIGI
jgi:hypothetical protein